MPPKRSASAARRCRKRPFWLEGESNNLVLNSSRQALVEKTRHLESLLSELVESDSVGSLSSSLFTEMRQTDHLGKAERAASAIQMGRAALAAPGSIGAMPLPKSAVEHGSSLRKFMRRGDGATRKMF